MTAGAAATGRTRAAILKRPFAVLVLAAVLFCGAAPGRTAQVTGATRGDAPADVRVTDLAEMVAGLSRKHPDKADISQSVYLSAAASVHVHVPGFEQTTPLHIAFRPET